MMVSWTWQTNMAYLTMCQLSSACFPSHISLHGPGRSQRGRRGVQCAPPLKGPSQHAGTRAPLEGLYSSRCLYVSKMFVTNQLTTKINLSQNRRSLSSLEQTRLDLRWAISVLEWHLKFELGPLRSEMFALDYEITPFVHIMVGCGVLFKMQVLKV